MKVPAPVLLIVPVLVSVSEPWPPAACRMAVPVRFSVPALAMTLVPGSSSMLPATVAVAPASMVSVRPANMLPVPVPEKVSPAPEVSTTALPPVQLPFVPLQTFVAPDSVSVPAPPRVPPVWVKLPAMEVAPLNASVPPASATSPPKLLGWATVSDPPVICSVRPAATVMLLTAWAPDEMTIVGPAVVMKTSSPAPGSVDSPQFAALVQVMPSPRPVQ